MDNSIDIKFNKNFDKILLESDKEQISRVFLNLIKNSIESINQKAQNNRNFNKKITIELIQEDSHIRITIEDNGVGFPEDLDINKVESLGMLLVNTLVEQIDGDIEIRSKEGTKVQMNKGTQENKKKNGK